MKLLIPCSKCIQEEIEPTYNFYGAELNDDGIYKLTCDQGHETIAFIQEQSFEILFDLGAMALLEGYTREAVSSFASSLERFYEFCIKLILEQNKIEREHYEKTWKMVSKMSERQLGAFYFLYLNQFKVIPPQINNLKIGKRDLINFRNEVIHQGHIPSFEDTKKYGRYLYEYITEIIKTFRSQCWDGYGKMATQSQSKYKKLNQLPSEPGTFSVFSIPTMINSRLGEGMWENRDFDKAFYELREYIMKTYTK